MIRAARIGICGAVLLLFLLDQPRGRGGRRNLALVGRIVQLLPNRGAHGDVALEQLAQRGQDMDRFFKEASERFAGRDVFLFAVWPILFEWAEEGLKRGIKNVFGSNSVLSAPSSLQTWRANSTTATCMPRQMPR